MNMTTCVKVTTVQRPFLTIICLSVCFYLGLLVYLYSGDGLHKEELNLATEPGVYNVRIFHECLKPIVEDHINKNITGDDLQSASHEDTQSYDIQVFNDEFQWADTRPNPKTVAIGCAITTKKFPTRYSVRELPFFNMLMKSFCKTASSIYTYTFYVTYDYNDDYMLKHEKEFAKEFIRVYKERCVAAKVVNVFLKMTICPYSHAPAWSQNDATMQGYLDNMAYFYRVNDDTILIDKQWTEKFILQLLKHNPPNMGVVGPSVTAHKLSKGGINNQILTYDFVHHTHVDIFGFYYPRKYRDWHADSWITLIYQNNNRSTKLPTAKVWHKRVYGMRYNAHKFSNEDRNKTISIDQTKIDRYIQYRGSKKQPNSGPESLNKALCISLDGNETRAMQNAIHLAQMIKHYMYKWTFYVYIPVSSGDESNVPHRILKKLRFFNANIIWIQTKGFHIPQSKWCLLLIDLQSIDYIFSINEYRGVIEVEDLQTLDTHVSQDVTTDGVDCKCSNAWGIYRRSFSNTILGTDTMQNYLKSLALESKGNQTQYEDVIVSRLHNFISCYPN